MSITINILEAVIFLDIFAVTIISSYIPAQVRFLGNNNELYVGLVNTSFAVCHLISGPFIGSLADAQGRKQILTITLLVCGLVFTCMGYVDSVLIILILRSITGFKQSQTLSRALVTDYEKNGRKQADIYGKMAALSEAGLTLGTVLVGHIDERYQEKSFYVIADVVGFSFALNTCLVFLLPNPPNQQPRVRRQDLSFMLQLYENVTQSFVQLNSIEWSKYGDIFVYQALIAFAMTVFYSNYGIFLLTMYTDLPIKDVCYIVTVHNTAGTVTNFFSAYIFKFYTHDKDYGMRMFHVFFLLSGALIGLILSYNLYMYVFWLIPLAVGNAVGRLVILEMLVKRCRKYDAGKLLGAAESVGALASALAPLVSGLTGQYIGILYVIYISLCTTFVGLVITFRRKRK